MFGDSTTGLSATLQSFSHAMQTMANSPSQTSTRQAVLTQAQALISQFQSYQSNLTSSAAQVNSQISSRGQHHHLARAEHREPQPADRRGAE